MKCLHPICYFCRCILLLVVGVFVYRRSRCCVSILRVGFSGARERMRVCGKKGAKESVCVCSGGESFARERERVWGERVFWVRIGK